MVGGGGGLAVGVALGETVGVTLTPAVETKLSVTKFDFNDRNIYNSKSSEATFDCRASALKQLPARHGKHSAN